MATDTFASYLARIQALYPWLPTEIARIFATNWVEHGDEVLALAETRQSAAYATWLPGMVRADGSLRFGSEQEYFATTDGYTRALIEAGLNPTLWTSRFVEWIEGDTSVSEVVDRIAAAQTTVLNNLPAIRIYYSAAYGIDLTDAAILASFLDPDIGDAILSQRIAVSQVGGSALTQGFDLEVGFVEQLVASGVDQRTATDLFAQAAERLPTLGALTERFGQGGGFDVESFAAASVLGDVASRRRIERLLRASEADFAAQGRLLADEARLTGLTPA